VGGKCAKEKMLTTGTMLKFAVEHNEFTNEKYFCEGSETQIELLSTGSATETVKARILNWTLTTCSIAVDESCVVKIENLPYLAEFHWTTGGDGTMTVGPDKNGEPSIRVECGLMLPLFVTRACTYSGKPTLLFKGAEPANLRAEGASFSIVNNVSGNCSATAPWDATFLAKSPVGIWMAKE